MPIVPGAEYTVFVNFIDDPADLMVVSLTAYPFDQPDGRNSGAYFQHMAVGTIEHIGNWDVGTIISGSRSHLNLTARRSTAGAYDPTELERDDAPLFSANANANTYLRIDMDNAPNRGDGVRWASACPAGSATYTGKELALPIHSGSAAKIPDYRLLRSVDPTDSGRDVNRLNCITVNMNLCCYVLRDPDVLRNFSPVGYVPGVHFISLKNVAPGRCYEISYPKSGDKHQVFPYTRRRGLFGMDGFSVKGGEGIVVPAPLVAPSQKGTLTYDGSPQSPDWNDYDPAKMTLTITPQTDAGTYTATFGIIGDYKWRDRTTAPKSVQWSIDRATIPVPSQRGMPRENGSPQSPDWNGYTPGTASVALTPQASAGVYSATFGTGNNYRWDDGTIADKTVPWVIVKNTFSLVDVRTCPTPPFWVGSSGSAQVTGRNATGFCYWGKRYEYVDNPIVLQPGNDAPAITRHGGTVGVQEPPVAWLATDPPTSAPGGVNPVQAYFVSTTLVDGDVIINPWDGDKRYAVANGTLVPVT